MRNKFSIFYKYLLLMGMLFIFVILPGKSVRAEEQKVVRVGFDGTYKTTAEGDVPSGYEYECYQKIADYTGWKFEYVSGSLDEILEKLKTGEIDIYQKITYSDERAEYLYYTSRSQGVAEYYIMTTRDNDLDVVEDIQGKKVGILRGSFAERIFDVYIEENSLDCEIVLFDTDGDALKALSSGEIDAIFSFPNNVTSNLAVSLKFVGPSIASNPFYFVVSKEREDLYEELEDALSAINENEPTAMTEIFSKYSTVNTELAAEGKEWVAKHDKLRVGYANTLRPYLISTDGKLSGVYADLLNQISTKYDLALQYTAYDSMEELSAALAAGEIDLYIPAYLDERFAETYQFARTKKITSNNYMLVYLESPNLESANIAVGRSNYMLQAVLQDNYPNANLVVYDTTEDCVEAVNNGEVDCTLFTEAYYIYDHLKHAEMYEDLQMVQAEELSFDLGFGVSRGNTELLYLLDYEIEMMDSGFIQNSIAENSNYDEAEDFSQYVRRHPIQMVVSALIVIFLILMIFLLYVREARRVRRAQNQAIAAEKDANRAKSDFLSRMSHDIRTPMNGIVGQLYILDHNREDEQVVDESINKLSVTTKQLQSLLNDILDMSRLENGKEHLENKSFSLTELIDDCILMSEPPARRRKVGIYKNYIDVTHESVYGSPRHIERIVMNILSNAVKYNKENGSIYLTVREECAGQGRAGSGSLKAGQDYSRYTIIVEDTGIGMDEEFVQKVFVPFERAKEDSGLTTSGSGLGMAIVKDLVELMGGEISVVSEPGKGTTFTVTIPLVPDLEATQVESEDESTISLEDMHILLVDDNELNRSVTEYILTDHGAEVTLAENGKEAVDAFTASSEGDFDMILMDVRMPVMDGYEATRIIRSMPRPDAGRIPIIAQTANAFTEDVEKCLESGMNDFLAKPIDVDKMMRLLKKYQA